MMCDCEQRKAGHVVKVIIEYDRIPDKCFDREYVLAYHEYCFECFHCGECFVKQKWDTFVEEL